LTMLGIDDLELAAVEVVLRGDRSDALLRPDQDRLDELHSCSFDHGFERGFVAGMSNRGFCRRMFLRSRYELMGFVAGIGVGPGRGFKHGHRRPPSWQPAPAWRRTAFRRGRGGACPCR